ncbi:MAG: Ldh family oxidoreductase [Pseudomonadota bacterium]|nr:Ldh family oxidoreductase [Pseudomonadota bacterium]
MSDTRYAESALVGFAQRLLVACGLETAKADDVAHILVTGDLLGHTTHGLALLSPYLGELENGGMTRTGISHVIQQRQAVELWDGKRLPGPWLTLRALEAARSMAHAYGIGTVVIRRSHHIACLAAYLLHATERGMIAIIQSSDPLLEAVVPHGGTTPVMTPNPIAAGLPTNGDPILIDVSTSITSMGATMQARDRGQKLPGPWLIDAQGNPTDDPNAVLGDPKGALLPLGGLDAGHKGFALGLLVEALTAGLAGLGRADAKEGWGGTVFVQVIDPEAFAGIAAFKRQMDHMASTSHASKPRQGVERVRLPGERGMERLREQRAHGVQLRESIMPSLIPWARKLDVPVIQPL